MAEIPVEKKGGMPWWVWLLLALLVALLLWWLLDNDDEREQVAAAPYEEVAAPVDAGTTLPADTGAVAGTTAAAGSAGDTASGPITDLAAFGGATAASTLAGRQVELSGVPVLEMVSDAGFYIGSSPADRVYVLLDEQKTPNTPGEGRVNVNKGQTIGLSGTVRSAADGAPTGLVLPQGVERYIWANSVTIR